MNRIKVRSPIAITVSVLRSWNGKENSVPVPGSQSEHECHNGTHRREGREARGQSMHPTPPARHEAQHRLRRHHRTVHNPVAGRSEATPRAMLPGWCMDVAMLRRGSPQGLAAALKNRRAEVDEEYTRDRCGDRKNPQ